MTIETFTFTNGFRLIHEKPKSQISISSIYCFVDLGSVYETDNIRGGSHFIEHLCFKGTKKLPSTIDISTEYDKNGAYFNAFTENRLTCYKVKTQDDYIEHCITILSDIMLNSTFPKKEFTKEENVVIEESIQNKDDPQELLYEMGNTLLYNGSSYSYSVDTFDYHKQKFKYEDIVALYKAFYHPSRFVLSIVSNYSFEKIKKMLKKTYFLQNRKMTNCDNYPIYYSLIPQTDIQYKIKEKSGLHATYLLIAFRTCNHQHTDRYCLNMFKNLLMGTLSSRLFILLRDEHGLTYSSDAYTTYYEHSGEFTIYTEVDNTKIIKDGNKKGVLPLIIWLINDLIKNGITQEEFNLTKNNYNGKQILKQGNIDLHANHNGREFLIYGKNVTSISDMYNVFYKDINKNDIERVIKTYFKKQNMNVCLYGSNIPSLNVIKRECEHILQ